MSIFLTGQFRLFLFVGGAAALAHWLARIAATPILGYEHSVFFSYFVGLAVAFLLNKTFVFPTTRLAMRTQLTRFLVVNFVTMPLVWGTAIGLENFLSFISDDWWRQSIAHGVAVSIPAFSSFLAYKYFAFR